MTPAQRQKRYRDRKRREREAQPARKRERRRKGDRDRKRDGRAAAKVSAAADRPAAPDQPGNLIEFCSGLTVTQGDHEGERLTVLGWQAAVLRVVEKMAAGGRSDRNLDPSLGRGSASMRPPGGEYGLSLPAGGGKTTLIAAIATASLVWEPMVRRRADVMVVAGSFPQAGIAFDTARDLQCAP